MKTRLFLILLGLSLALLAHANNAPTETSHQVPKSLQDIVQLIDQTSSNTAERDANLKLINSTPAEAASKSEKFAFYYRQNMAADQLGRSDIRLQALKSALENAKPDDQEEISVAVELAVVEFTAGDSRQGLERLLKLKSKIPDRLYGWTLSINSFLGNFYGMTGDFEKAEQILREVQSGFTFLQRSPNFSNHGWSWSRAYFNTIANLRYQQGRFQESEVAYRKAIEQLERGLPGYEKTYAGLPGASVTSASHPDSLKFMLERLYLSESNSLLKLRKVNEAEYYAREALKKSLQRTGKSSVATAASMRQLAIVMLARSRNKDAIYLLDQSLTSLKVAGVSADSLELARTEKTMASALIADERYGDALKLYASLDAKIAQKPEIGRIVDANSLDRVLALMRQGSLADAQTRASQLLTATETRVGKKSPEATQIRLMLAMVMAEQKQDAEARKLFATGLAEVIEQEREAAADSEGLSSKEKNYRASIIESYLGLLSREYAKNPSPALAAESFALGDLARSSGVQRALNASTARANITDKRLAELVRKEQDLNQRISFLSRFAKELSMQPASQQLPQIQAKMKADIEELRAEAKKTLHLIGLDFPEYAELINPKPVALDKLAKALRPNEALVTWFIGQQHSFVWALSHEGKAEFKALPIARQELRQHITQLRKTLDPQVLTIEEIPPFNFALSHKLYNSLFLPVQDALQGKSTLVVVPHDEIGQLPLGVLTTAAFDPGPKSELLFANYRSAPWLLKQHALVSAPSATAINTLRGLAAPKHDRRDFIGFGDPLFSLEQAQSAEKVAVAGNSTTQIASRGVPLKLRSSPNTSQVSSAEISILPRLPDTNDEIQEIAKVFNVEPSRDIFLQKRANLEEILKADLYNRKVVMFSTHGLVPGELDGLTQPALALTNPQVLNKTGDGLLKVDQILMLKLNADWVVLSACNTAAGEGDGAEALSGLGRAFFYAGARSLLVSSWPVDSLASRKLMTDLFRRQVQDKSLTKPKALQQASLELMEKGTPTEQSPLYSYAHPLFWAPFSMVGD
jgi:CHAT domain-containing protein